MRRILLWYLLLVGCAQAAPTLAVFPSAEGFGTRTVGGRGGVVCQVTTLDDHGRGSLRACLEQSAPRIIVFTTGGIIRLQTPLVISEPYVTLAGQTATGDGIMLTSTPELSDALLIIKTHDVVIQHLRLRNTPQEKADCCDTLRLSGAQTYNIVIDHCSLSGAGGKIIASQDDVHDVTLSNSIIGSGQYRYTADADREQAGGLFGGGGVHSLSLHHNLWVHNEANNPNIRGGAGIVDFVNNLIYNWGEGSSVISSVSGAVQVNLIHNLYIRGPDSNPETAEIVAHYGGKRYQLFLEENLSIRDREQPEPLPVDFVLKEWPNTDWEASTRFLAPPITTVKAHTLPQHLFALVGATLPQRDSFDKQLIQEVSTHTGNIPRSKASLAAWQDYATGTPPPDSDNDGIPDHWEQHNKLDPNKADAVNDRNNDGYTNIEEWIFSLSSQ